MNLLEESDQITYSFLFIITPLEIISTKSIKNLKKSLLLKLGNKTQKTSQLNKPIQIPVQVLYSKTLKKYCPIKGIIKVYDINSDGSEVISSVGGFQTEEILNEQKSNVIIERDIGTSKVKMRIQIQNLGTVRTQLTNNQKQKQSTQYIKPAISRIKTRQNTPQNQSHSLANSRSLLSSSQNSQKSDQQKLEDYSKKEKANNIFKRTSPISQISQIEANKSMKLNKKEPNQVKSDINPPNQQAKKIAYNISVNKLNSAISVLVKQTQHQNQSEKSLERSIKQSQSDRGMTNSLQYIDILKNKIDAYEKSRQDILFHFQNISDCLQTKGGKIRTQFNQKMRTLNWKYKNKPFQKIFSDFFQFIQIQLSKPRNNENINEVDEQMLKLSFKAEDQANTNIRIKNEQLTRRTSENLSLRAMERQKGSLQIKLKSKQRQCLELENRIKEIESFRKTLKQENIYLKQKDETMQQIISEKQNQIQIIKQQFTEVELQYKEMESTIKNDACEIEELRQEVSNLNEIIESYREKYGDLKNVKNRALQNELKECLIWIDQQTRQLQMSDFAEETQPSHSHNVSEIIKNIELQGASRQEMNSIKTELAGLIKRIDNFLAK